MLGLRRVLAVLGVLSALVWVGSAAANAAGNPGRQPLPTPPDVVGPLCGEAMGTIVAHVSVDRQYIKTFTAKDGTVKYQVNGFAAVTVSGNGKTVTVNASGPGSITLYSDGNVAFVLEGHTIYLAPPSGGVWVYTGLVLFDANTGTVISHNGHTTDVCALLK